jgi:uncharacterized protein (UPF0210 family)
MKIRSVTYFCHPGDPFDKKSLNLAESFAKEARGTFESAGYEVQSIRFATPPFPTYVKELSAKKVIKYALELERILIDIGYAYLSLGPALPDFTDSYALIPEIIQNTESTFVSGSMTDPQRGISLSAVRSCGEIIQKLAPLDSNGFANLYFTALGNVPPGAPFFPAAYADGSLPYFSVAVEGADLAVKAFRGSSIAEVRQALITSIETHGAKISEGSQKLEKTSGANYAGIDFSLAPFPEKDLSIGTALEALGISGLGVHGSLAAAAFLADTIDQADFLRTGFSGLMLPVLEDAILAKRAAEGILSIKDLLLYSTVCGTGLDTIPLPGDISKEQISAILMDLAALSLRLDKPLTARLMPIPGKKAGEPTNFDFPFFANSKIMGVDGGKISGLFSGDESLDLSLRSKKD